MADFDTGDVVRLGLVQKFKVVWDIVNVIHVQITAGGGLAFAAAAQDFQEFADAIAATIASIVTDDQLPDYISVKNITQDTVWGNIAWNLYAGGASATDPLAAQLSLLVFGRTQISRVQLRKYLGVFTEGQLTEGVWSAGTRSLGQAYVDYLVAGHTMGNGSVLRGCAYNPTLDRVTFALTGATSEAPVVQRRRRVGRGS